MLRSLVGHSCDFQWAHQITTSEFAFWVFAVDMGLCAIWPLRGTFLAIAGYSFWPLQDTFFGHYKILSLAITGYYFGHNKILFLAITEYYFCHYKIPLFGH